MEIAVNKSYSRTYIKFRAENVLIEDDVTETIHALKEDGKKDFSKILLYDIEDNTMDLFSRTLEDLVYYRERDYDSSSLISYLFDKLPKDKLKELLTQLKKDYDED